MASDLQTNEPNMGQLVSGIVHDASELIKQQFQLLKVEVQEDSRKTREAAFWAGLGLGTTLVGSIILCMALALLLSWSFDTPAGSYSRVWVWFLVVGAAATTLGVGWLLQARAQFSSFNPLPDKTAEALQENLQWQTKPK